jgi:hypothetical protein
MHSHQKARIRRENLNGLLTAGAAVAVVLAAGGAVGLAKGHDVPVDAAHCPVSGLPTTSTVIVDDLSDAPLGSQREALLQAVLAERDRTPERGKLVLLSVNAASPFEPVERLALCSPLPERASNVMVHTPSKVRDRWRDDFGQPVEAAAAAASRSPGSAASPIVEAVSAAAWRPDWSASQEHRRLVIISDLLQHDPQGFSLYRQDVTAFTRAVLAHKAVPDLGGVEVEIVELKRPDQLARQAAMAEPFWVAWLTARGASEVRFQGEPRARRPDPELVRLLSSTIPQPQP